MTTRLGGTAVQLVYQKSCAPRSEGIGLCERGGRNHIVVLCRPKSSERLPRSTGMRLALHSPHSSDGIPGYAPVPVEELGNAPSSFGSPGMSSNSSDDDNQRGSGARKGG